jgi:hypothetical protein
MAEPQFKGSKPGYKKAPTAPLRTHTQGGYQDSTPAKNDNSTRRNAPTKKIGGTGKGAH